MSNGLAERAVVCKAWRWLPGMLAVDTDDGCTHRVACVTRSGYPLGCLPQDGGRVWELGANELPALTDPATFGCLLVLVREAWQDPEAHAYPYEGRWAFRCEEPNAYPSMFTGDSEIEVLVKALEGAP